MKKSIFKEMKSFSNLYFFRFFYFVFSAFFLFSCAAGQPFFIEVKKPADIFLPIDIAKVLVMDNFVLQPGNEKVSQIYDGDSIKKPNLDFASGVNMVAYSLLSELFKSDFFNDVAFAGKILREDDDWDLIKPITPDIKVLVLDTLLYDAIFSLDKITYTVDEDIKNKGPRSGDSFLHFVDMKIELKVDASIYLYNQDEVFLRCTVLDSVKVNKLYEEDFAGVAKNLPNRRIFNLSRSVGRKLAQTIVPVWERKERFIYTGVDPRSREAKSFINNQKWEEAKIIMIAEYNNEKKASNRGKYANNIALCYEMLDEVENAFEWANLAQQEFEKSNLNSKSKELNRSRNYIKEMEERMKYLPLLNEY